jgi:hypothetical protein
LLLLQARLESIQGSGDFIGRVSILLHQILHDAHALVETALHGRHLFLQLLNLGLQLDHFLADTPSWRRSNAERREQGKEGKNAL